MPDFSKPAAVTLLAILHAIPDSDGPHAIVARLTDAVPSGGYLAVSHAAVLAGADLVPPGLVRVEEWRPDRAAAYPEQSSLRCAVGRKR